MRDARHQFGVQRGSRADDRNLYRFGTIVTQGHAVMGGHDAAGFGEHDIGGRQVQSRLADSASIASKAPFATSTMR